MQGKRSSILKHGALAALVLVSGAYLAVMAAPDPPKLEQKPYRIVNGKVDEATYRGWQIYHSTCHGCHGVDATGTPVGPSLVERMQGMSAHDFTVKVLTSYRIVLDAGSVHTDDPTAVREAIVAEVLRRERGEVVMPAWESNDKVRPHLLDLYAYLKARADGALGTGKPQRIGK